MAQHVGAVSPLRVETKRKNGMAHMMGIKFRFFGGTSLLIHRNFQFPVFVKDGDGFYNTSRPHRRGAVKCFQSKEDHSSSSRGEDEGCGERFVKCKLAVDDFDISKTRQNHSSKGLSEACRYVHNDAKFVNERARNDMILLSRGISSLNNRARQDVAILGVGFLKLDARAREDAEKIDLGVKVRAEHLHQLAMILKDKAGSKLKRVADKHWSDGALEADLRRADLLVKTRAMKDAFMALEFIRNTHNMMVTRVSNMPMEQTSSSIGRSIMLQKKRKAFSFLSGEISADRINALQEIYWSMASALSEADGIDYTDPEELECLVRTLIDLDAMDGKNCASLLAECSSSPDVGTRKALANALSAAPSMWTLGNAGMGALQRLADDSNPTVAAAASKAINELRKQWEVDDRDNFQFTMNALKADGNIEDGSGAEE